MNCHDHTTILAAQRILTMIYVLIYCNSFIIKQKTESVRVSPTLFQYPGRSPDSLLTRHPEKPGRVAALLLGDHSMHNKINKANKIKL